MSFGYGTGDFISVLLFANEIRRRFVYAPTHFRGATESIKSLSNTLRDIEDIYPENVLSKAQRRQLEDMSRSCCGVLQDLQRVLLRYQDLDLDLGSSDPGTTRDSRSSSRRVWQRLKWDPKEIQNFEQRICGQVAIFNLFMGRLNLQVNLTACETTTRSRDEIAAIQRYHTDDEYDKILDWLSPVNYAAQQNDFLNQQQEGSGQWLLGASQFRDWVKNDGVTLFCPGIPGAGKTIMVSMIIDHLEQDFGHISSIGIAYIYCSFRRRPTQTSRDLLASLVRQLVQRNSEIPDCIRKAYSQSRNKKIQPGASEVRRFLQVFSTQLSRIFIVVDALDECESTARETLLAAIYSLQDNYNVNFLATSRYIPDILAAFERCPSLEIRATMEDVWRYLHSQLSRLPSFVFRNKQLQCEIIAEVSKAVGGMFLLAKLHLDSLVGKRSQKAVQMALKSLPSGSNAYDSAYRTAMERIEGQVPDRKEMAKQVLSWITCAGPLTTRELQHALAVEVGQTYFDEANVSDVEDIVSVCAGLVIVDEQSNIIRLVHYTAQEYFERTWTEWFPDAQRNIAATCLTYLLFDFPEGHYGSLGESQVDPQAAGVFDKYPLYRYAAQNWGRHGHIEGLDPDLVLKLLENKTKLSCAAQMLLEDGSWLPPKELDGLHLASYFGLEKAVHMLIDRGGGVDTLDSLGRSPLSWAAGEGHTNLVRLLLELGATRNLKDKSWQTPLSWAAKTGHRDVTELLLNRGADRQSRDRQGQTPLSLAAKYGQQDVVQCLLNAGADVAVCKDNNGQTALFLAANRNHLDTMKLLVEREGEHSLGNKPGIPQSAATVQVREEENQDILNVGGCEKGEPRLPSGDQSGHVLEASASSEDGCFAVSLSRGSTMGVDIDWTD